MKVYGWMCVSIKCDGIVDTNFFQTQHAASKYAIEDGPAEHVHILPFCMTIDDKGTIVE